MGMHLAMTCINHQPFIIRVIDQDFQQLFPYTLVTPTDKPAMRITPIAIIWWKITPRSTCAQYPKNCVDKLAIILRYTTPTTLTAWKVRF
jgi:hypothetical protein